MGTIMMILVLRVEEEEVEKTYSNDTVRKETSRGIPYIDWFLL